MGLIIAFKTKALREVCEWASRAEALCGTDIASRLQRRLADLAAAETIFELPTNKPQPIDGAGLMAIELGDDVRLLFAPNHKVLPRTPSGGIDWNKVFRIKLVLIEGIEGIDES